VKLDLAAVAILRFGIPALVFLPVLLRTGLFPRGVAPLPLAAMALCGGIGFFFAAAFGLRLAPAAEAGPLMPGTMPLFVALLSVLVLGDKLGWRRAAGFVLIGCGVMAIVGYRAVTAGNLSFGHLLVMAAALTYAIFTILFRRSGMSALAAAAVVSGWSAILVLPFGVMPLIAAVRSGMTSELILQGVVQGIVSGVLALVLYGMAVTRLGAPRAAAFTALIPAVVALLAVPFLGEYPNTAAIIGIVIVSAGVALANWPGRN
jgi:drug/metabolite transporter (DMT)-like permease